MAPRKRLDLLLVERGLADSREKAKRLIMSGTVMVDGQLAGRPSDQCDHSAVVSLSSTGCPYVGRGGIKLEKALNEFAIDPGGRIAADVGSSTGGFTDCLLQHGAKLVYAIDVGKGQLAWKLRNDPRVVVFEGVNARYGVPGIPPATVEFMCVDVSFISLAMLLPGVLELVAPTADIICLIKPQFEADRGTSKKGIIRDPDTHVAVLERVIERVGGLGLCLKGLTFSPVKGAKGNIEFLGIFSLEAASAVRDRRWVVSETVAQAHADLQVASESRKGSL